MMNKNKKGMATFGLFLIIGFILVSIIGLGLLVFVSGTINDVFDDVGMVGQVNFSEASADTWGQFDSGIKNSANFLGLSLIFGLFIGLMLVAYFLREEKPILMFILDIFIIFFAFIMAGYISDSYAILIGVQELSDAFVQNMNLVAKIMLNLPIFVLVFGILTMIISYSGIPKEKEERVAGF